MMDNSIKWKIKKASRQNWKKILPALTDLPLKVFKNIHQPCPLCRDGDDRYRFDDNKGYGTYYCNHCGAGDGFAFLQKRLKKSEDEVYLMMGEFLGVTSGKAKIELSAYSDRQSEIPDIRVIVPAPIHSKEAYFKHYKFGEPSKVWEYKNSDGDVFFYICRFDFPDGKKEVLPMTYCHYYDSRNKTMRYGWRWKGVTKNEGVKRPLYNLEELLKPENADKWVMVVEGEKASDAGAELIKEVVVVTWSGGTKAIGLTDWTPLSRRNVYVWGDHDCPGYSAAIEIQRLLLEYNENRTVKLIVSPDSKAKGWDLGDAKKENAEIDKLKNYIGATAFESLHCEIK